MTRQERAEKLLSQLHYWQSHMENTDNPVHHNKCHEHYNRIFVKLDSYNKTKKFKVRGRKK